MVEERGLINQKDTEERLNSLEETLNSIKKALLRQNEVILRLSERVMGSLSQKKEENNDFFVSTGNEGVNQSINNQSTITNHPTNSMPQNNKKTSENTGSTGNEGVQEPIALAKQSDEGLRMVFKQAEKSKLDDFERLRDFKAELNDRFKRLSRQELKTFLAIYQLGEEGVNPTYRAISGKMALSEHCIRAHVCSLFKKNAPLEKSRLNNRLALIFVKKDFKTLNLKNKLLDLYYKSDINQTTLFDPS
jgi:hypothetical protein